MIFPSFAVPGKKKKPNFQDRKLKNTSPAEWRSERSCFQLLTCSPAFQSPAQGSCRIQPSCGVQQRTAAFLLWGMQRWRGAPWTLHMGWRSGTGHSETLFWATCAEVVKSARRALHSVSLAVSVSVGGQRAGGAPAHADPGTSFRRKPGWLGAAGSCSKTLTVCSWSVRPLQQSNHHRYTRSFAKVVAFLPQAKLITVVGLVFRSKSAKNANRFYMKLYFWQYYRNTVQRL